MGRWLQEQHGYRLELVKQAWIEHGGKWAWKRGRMTYQREKAAGFHVLPRRWVVENTQS